jgi:hypothetical protein
VLVAADRRKGAPEVPTESLDSRMFVGAQIATLQKCGFMWILDCVVQVKQVMRAYGNGRDECGMHHIHATRQDAGVGPSNWHRAPLPPPTPTPPLDTQSLTLTQHTALTGGRREE